MIKTIQIHTSTNITKHSKNTFPIKYTYQLKNILINDFNTTCYNIIEKHKQKFIYFFILYKINNRKYKTKPTQHLLPKHNNDTKIDIDISIYSRFEDISYDYYLTLPKSRLETLLAKNFDRYPDKLKLFPHSNVPYYKRLTLKHQVFADDFDWV